MEQALPTSLYLIAVDSPPDLEDRPWHISRFGTKKKTSGRALAAGSVGNCHRPRFVLVLRVLRPLQISWLCLRHIAVENPHGKEPALVFAT